MSVCFSAGPTHGRTGQLGARLLFFEAPAYVLKDQVYCVRGGETQALSMCPSTSKKKKWLTVVGQTFFFLPILTSLPLFSHSNMFLINCVLTILKFFMLLSVCEKCISGLPMVHEKCYALVQASYISSNLEKSNKKKKKKE